MMCTATKELCPDNGAIAKTVELVDATMATIGFASDVATMNVAGFFSTGLKLLDDYAHPNCF